MSRRYDYDFIVIGSGFGGAVSALRLSEKGYKVAVLEAGRRFGKDDFPTTNWNIKDYVFEPSLGLNGFMRYTLLPDQMILGGAGVGGGSLVYANTLYIPPDTFFDHPTWAHIQDWKAALMPHYETAERMLGVTDNRFMGPGDRILQKCAEEMGKGDTFRKTRVGVLFGEPGESIPDPFFDGKGPDRTACNYCGGCMVGCRYGAKNTLDLNYLYLAEGLGAEILPGRTALDIRPLSGGGYVVAHKPTMKALGGHEELRARGVVVSAGALGTLKLLFGAKMRGSLPRISDFLGRRVRSNSESILAVSARGETDEDYSKGIAITTSFFPDDHTHIEVVRYSKGSDLNFMLSHYLTDGGKPWPRALSFLSNALKHPLDFARLSKLTGWAEKSTILLVMQTKDNSLRVTAKPTMFGGVKLLTEPESGGANPTWIPVANEVARMFARHMDGIPQSSLNEAVLNVPVTAHILGGVTINDSPDTGVISPAGEVYGYDNLFVADGSVIPANLGVNPSLSITALSEYLMSQMPESV